MPTGNLAGAETASAAAQTVLEPRCLATGPEVMQTPHHARTWPSTGAAVNGSYYCLQYPFASYLGN